MTGKAWSWCAARRVLLLAGLGVSVGALVGTPPAASAETVSSTGTETSNCPSSNPPNELTLVAGTPQTTTLDQAFSTGLQVALANSDGCPVTTAAAGVPVTFSVPSSGPSGLFSDSGSNTITVGSDASGAVLAPAFTANDTMGTYTLIASSTFGSVSFSLTNSAAGIPARIIAIGSGRRSARVTGRYSQPLQVKVLDTNGNPVAGATVTFTLGSARTSACGTTASASASFIGASTQASATTGSSGVATSPTFAANSAAGSFSATASVSNGGAPAASGTGTSAADGGTSGAAGAVTPGSFALANLPGNPTKLTTGVASTQSTTAGSSFAIRLAVTVTDAEKNPVPGALTTFAAPARGPSGRFTTHSRGPHHHSHVFSHPRTVKVETDACGIALAPPFTANQQQGGYIVKATAKHAKPAAFALVNEVPGQAP